MESNYFVKEVKLVANESSSKALKDFGKDGFDISGGNPRISYFESIFSPSISITLSDILDVDQFVSRYGLTGGEYLKIKV